MSREWRVENGESGVENRELRVEPLCGDVVVSPARAARVWGCLSLPDYELRGSDVVIIILLILYRFFEAQLRYLLLSPHSRCSCHPHTRVVRAVPTLALLMWGFRQRRRPGGSLLSSACRLHSKNSRLSILNSPFSIFNSPFSILNSPFSIPSSRFFEDF